MAPTPTQSAAFTQVLAGDEVNTLTDISGYVKSTVLPRNNADLNTTTFAPGGGPVTESHQRGAVQSQPTVDAFADPVIWPLLNRIVAARGGSTWHWRSGINAAPSPGDEVFLGTYTLFGINLTYNPNQEATMALDLRPTDAGAILPGWLPL